MKAIKTLSFLFIVLIFACYLEKIEPEKSSDSYYSSPSSSPAPSSSSQIVALQDSISISEQFYRTIKMGSTIWLAKNLNAIPKSGNWWCHGYLTTRCEEYGKLYDWVAAMNVCPDGWILPSKEDYDNLSNFDKSVLSTNSAWWNATFGGFKYEDDGDFSDLNEGYWWSSKATNNLAYYCKIREGGNFECNYITKARAFSVRCVKK
ncbi:hypothetical protein R83H12_00856 [Fibrobacteria bacterium R8-3-H12]